MINKIRSKNFTLVEVMISFGILMALLSIVFGTQTYVFRTFSQGMWQNEAKQSIKVFADRIINDLQKASYASSVDATGVLQPDYATTAPNPANQHIRYLQWTDAGNKKTVINSATGNNSQFLTFLIQTIGMPNDAPPVAATVTRITLEKRTVKGAVTIFWKSDNGNDGSYEAERPFLTDVETLTLSHVEEVKHPPAQWWRNSGTLEFDVVLRKGNATAIERFAIKANVCIQAVL